MSNLYPAKSKLETYANTSGVGTARCTEVSSRLNSSNTQAIGTSRVVRDFGGIAKMLTR